MHSLERIKLYKLRPVKRKRNKRDPKAWAKAQAEYQSYLQSAWWISRRESKLKQAGWKCEKCRSSSRLDVHHLDYTFRGAERDCDLQVLCRACHKDTHRPACVKRARNASASVIRRRARVTG